MYGVPFHDQYPARDKDGQVINLLELQEPMEVVESEEINMRLVGNLMGDKKAHLIFITNSETNPQEGGEPVQHLIEESVWAEMVLDFCTKVGIANAPKPFWMLAWETG